MTKIDLAEYANNQINGIFLYKIFKPFDNLNRKRCNFTNQQMHR